MLWFSYLFYFVCLCNATIRGERKITIRSDYSVSDYSSMNDFLFDVDWGIRCSVFNPSRSTIVDYFHRNTSFRMGVFVPVHDVPRTSNAVRNRKPACPRRS